VQKAYKDALTTEDRQKEAQAYLKAAEESPDAMDTPSGYAPEGVRWRVERHGPRREVRARPRGAPLGLRPKS
jgi:hypothetical protein